MQTPKKGSKKLLNAWAFYDWANSVYSLVIASSVFPLYYQALFSSAGIEYIFIFGGTIRSTPLITYTTAIAFIFISLVLFFTIPFQILPELTVFHKSSKAAFGISSCLTIL